MSGVVQGSRNLKQLSDAVSERHSNFIVSEVNDSCLRLAVNQGTYDWHHHPDSDELFMVLEGELRIEFEDQRFVILTSGETHLIPQGIVHRTIAKSRTVNLCFEKTSARTVFVKK